MPSLSYGATAKKPWTNLFLLPWALVVLEGLKQSLAASVDCRYRPAWTREAQTARLLTNFREWQTKRIDLDVGLNFTPDPYSCQIKVLTKVQT